MRKSILIFLHLITFWALAPVQSWATDNFDKTETQSENKQKDTDNKKTFTMSGTDAMKLAGRLVDLGDYSQATRILTTMPQTNNLSVEIERWYLIAQISQRQGDYDTAIKIYRKILDDQPDLIKIRYELALCYMAKEQWYRADYHLRLAMAGKDIPPELKKRMMYYRWIARKNKTWNVWFNFGAAPDNNVNQASNERICGRWYGWFEGCANTAKPEKAIGYNFILGGNYEFKLSEHWRWKNEANIYTNIYNKHDYDDLYLSLSTGPRYVWERGDIWLSGIAARRWYSWDKYNWSAGLRVDTNYDITRKLSTGLSLRVINNTYDEYDFIDGQLYSVNPRISYSIDATKYLVLRTGIDRETAKADSYYNWRYNVGLGFGSVLPWGFHIYLEPSFTWTNYDSERSVIVSDNNIIHWAQITERDFLQRYSVSLSNNKFDIWGFVPTLTFGYTKRDSNIRTQEYDKYSIEFTMQQKF